MSDDRQCARCDVPLFATTRAGFEIYGCGSCGGAWLDKKTTTEALTNRGPWVVELATKLTSATKVDPATLLKPAKCPQCKEPLDRVVTNGEELDVCKNDHGTWFDRGELLRMATPPSHHFAAPIAGVPFRRGKPAGTYRWLEIYRGLCAVFAGLVVLSAMFSFIDEKMSWFGFLLRFVGTFIGVATFLALRDACAVLLDLSERG